MTALKETLAGSWRKLSDEEMANLPTFGWKNARVDVKKYYVTFTAAYEVSAEAYEIGIAEGLCGQEIKGRYYLTNH